MIDDYENDLECEPREKIFKNLEAGILTGDYLSPYTLYQKRDGIIFNNLKDWLAGDYLVKGDIQILENKYNIIVPFSKNLFRFYLKVNDLERVKQMHKYVKEYSWNKTVFKDLVLTPNDETVLTIEWLKKVYPNFTVSQRYLYNIASKMHPENIKRYVNLFYQNNSYDDLVYREVLLRTDLSDDEKIDIFGVFIKNGIPIKNSQLDMHCWSYSDKIINWFFECVEPFESTIYSSIYYCTKITIDQKIAHAKRAHDRGFRLRNFRNFLYCNRKYPQEETFEYLNTIEKFCMQIEGDEFERACSLANFPLMQWFYNRYSYNIKKEKYTIYWQNLLLYSHYLGEYDSSLEEVKIMIQWLGERIPFKNNYEFSRSYNYRFSKYIESKPVMPLYDYFKTLHPEIANK